MNSLVIGADSFIGSALIRMLESRSISVVGTTHRNTANAENLFYFDLENTNPETLPDAAITYLCAGKTKFVECERDRNAYQVNVDAPRLIAKELYIRGICREKNHLSRRLIYLSSEAVEVALHTAYGLHKAFAENAVMKYDNACVVRLPRVGKDNVDSICNRLITIGNESWRNLVRIESLDN